MKYKGFVATQVQIVLAIIGVLIIVVIIGANMFQPKDAELPVATEETQTETEGTPQTETPEDTTPPIVSDLPTPSTPTSPSTPPPTTETPSGTDTSEVPSEPGTSTPTEPIIEPIPQPYNPGFLASSRITPEIPSENERANLPSCEGKNFTFDVVNTNAITAIDSNGTFNAGDPATFVWLSLPTNTELEEFDVIAPQDVWITHLTQQINLTEDNEDDAVYFALCKDVFGYVTHIKELADNTRDVLTESTCFGKPHVGENACLIETLDLVGRGSLLGKAGRIEGRFGLGVIDLRVERGLQNASQYSVKTNFAACPFDYFNNPSGYYDKLSNSNDLCSQPQ